MMRADRSRRRGRRLTSVRPGGFTLIELLVVVAIIALLISILLPSLARARRQARTLVCLTNLRSIGMACMSYGTDNDGYVPREHDFRYRCETLYNGERYAEKWPCGHAGHSRGPFNMLPQVISPYISGPQFPGIRKQTEGSEFPDMKFAHFFADVEVYQCPSFPQPDYEKARAAAFTTPQGRYIDESVFDYAVNAQDLTWTKRWLQTGIGEKFVSAGVTRLSRIPDGSAVVYLTEGNRNARWAFQDDINVTAVGTASGGHFWWNMRNVGTFGWFNDEYGHMLVDKRHGGGRGVPSYRANAVFFDGHGETRRLADLTIFDFNPYADEAKEGPPDEIKSYGGLD